MLSSPLRKIQLLTISLTFFLITAVHLTTQAAPNSVTLAGSLQDDISSCGEWDPACADTHLTEQGNDVWRQEFTLPAGDYEYKMVIDDDWANGSYPADNKGISVGADTAVIFYYDHKTNGVIDTINDSVAVAAGSFQSQLGCADNWQPWCVASLLTDSDGDGTYSFQTTGLDVGSYEFKVALDEAWDTAYPTDNVPFTTTTADDLVTITWDSSTTAVTVDVTSDEPQLSWVVAGNFQDDLPASASCGEWNNACPETTMEDDNGDGVFRLVGDDLPAGDYEYKIVETGNWDNAHPADNVPFSANGSQMRWYFQPDTLNIADNVNQCIATVAGSFQSILGGSDWSPDNLRSMMWQEEPGSDWYAFTATLPAGDYEYKVARNEAWDESYPKDNVGLNLGVETAVTFRYNCATNAVEHSLGGSDPGDADLVADPILHPIQDDIFYFVLPDRFSDGDPSNNTGGIPGDETDHGYLVDDKAFYHGGDLVGLTNQLDYLLDMGVTAIWMTPIFENNPVQPDSSTSQGVGAAYHGYWIVDFLNVDPHLGTADELQTFIDGAHARGIKVYFDIVINHTGDIIDYAESGNDYISKDDQPYLDANGDPFDDADFAGTDTFPELDPAISFPYTPVLEAGEETAKNPDWLNDTIYYHNRGNSTFSGENSLYGDFFGLDDLFTEHPDVVNGMTDIFKTWISDYGVDGFRIDTVKHVNIEFWQAFGPDIMAHAEAEGISEFFMFGEVFDGNPAFLSTFTDEGELPSVLDFGMQGTAVSFAARSEATDNVANFFNGDDYYTDPDSNAYQLANFISNHDIGRVGKAIQDNNPGADDAEMVARSQLAHALMFFSRGFPVLYYGDEQGFTGDGGDKDAREDMMPSQVAVYNDNNLIGTTATTADDNFDTNHVLYQTFADYAALRAAHPALSYGAQIQRYSQDSAGIVAFSRIDRVEQVEYLVVLNNAEGDASATFATYTPDATFSEIYPGTGSVSSDSNGDVSVTLSGLSVAIYRAETAVPTSTSAPGISFNTPSADDSVNGDIEIGVDLSDNTLAEVTFLVSVDGVDFELLGVDPNPAYRVYHDTDGYAEGTALTFKAIVSDLNGNLNSATLDVTVGAPPVDGDATYAIIHYYRPDGDYGDHTTGDFNDFWGLHLWGDAIDPSEVTEWTSPKPFLGQDDYGRFAYIKLADPSQPLNYIIHRGDAKDGTDADRFYIPAQNPELWTIADDGNNYNSAAAAQGFVTIRYHRPDEDYGDPSSDDFNDFWGLHLWGDAIDPSEATEWTSPKKPTGFDEFGAFWEILIVDDNQPVNFIIHRGDAKDPGPDQSFVPAEQPAATIWQQSGDETIYPTQAASENVAIIHYHRDDGDYGDPTSDDFNDYWGLHVWTGAADPNPSWQEPVKPAGEDIFGIFFEVPLVDGATELAYIIHRGDEKDPGPDQFLNLNVYGYEVWQLENADPEDPYILPTLFGGPGANPGNINEQRAYWVDEQTIAWPFADDSSLTYYLAYAPDGGLEPTDTGIEGGTLIELEEGTLSTEVQAKFPHLAGLPALQIPAGSLDLVPEILKGQMAVTAVDQDGNSANATGIQIPGVLDDLYTYSGDLGVSWDGGTPTIRVWAPTAKSVNLHLFADSDPATAATVIPMTWDAATGVWSVEGEASWQNQFYLFDVEVYVHSTQQVENNLVTDPYSFSLSINSQRSQIVDLSDPALMPDGWSDIEKPEFGSFEDISIYELHVRDFSIQDETVPEDYRGTYMAFTVEESNGMAHVQALAEAGLSHLHLLPVFDIATIEEDRSAQINPSFDELATYPPDSEEQQAIISATADQDGFNWGYDPFHYTTPEGSYSTNPDGSTRIVEFRHMVQSINDTGLRVVMDVVYNHTAASGQNDQSVLDKVVPGYYHRLNDSGAVETSTCCQNTASEHAMMEKLMIDSLVTWAVMYKVDAFRFDLMGHHMVSNMLNIRAALDELTLEEHGVDGSQIYLYGEGWNFGEVANNARGVNATQLNLAGTGIGTFSDRLRDAVRGGGPFDSGDALQTQGFGNGLYTDPNSYAQPDALDRLLLYSDQIRVGMAGNLATYEFVDRNGNVVTGAQVDYNGQPAGYTLDPQEDITYISKHDNQTLYDINVYGLPVDTPMDERVRAQIVGLSTVMYGQGVPFFHAGVDMLRSKSLDRDSFNSYDWFNLLDFSYTHNNFGVGLPVASKNQENWFLMEPLLADPALQANYDEITLTAALFQEMIAIRESSELFGLETAVDVQERVEFHNVGNAQLPGLIVMTISDKVGDDLDPLHETIVVVINSDDEPVTFSDSDLEGLELWLHPVLQNSVDARVKTTTFDSANGEIVVPGRTTAVFVEMEPLETQIDELAADVQALVDEGKLTQQTANKLLRDLSKAKQFVLQGKLDPQAVNQIRKFIRQLDDLGDNVADDVKAPLLAQAEFILLQLRE